MSVDLVANPGKATYVYSSARSRSERYAPIPEPEPKKTWRDDAACRGEDPELFFPDASDAEAHDEMITGFCDNCPVKAECLADDLATTGPRWGIRGGLSAEARAGNHPQKSTVNRPPLTECRRGHLYSAANTTTDSRGHRRCIACLKRDSERRKEARRKGGS